ncbi:hypothetical protein [Methylobacterium sp. 285MFTsu5.1]|uniref:hypothetical protein n=1 Tax=Methylobacterium sp. 285MFTsu5.1 TaxID=1172187 RepID=UPI0003A751E9|nr:hypothetical protein [Methylobacterium sp. 285MFTsu5.1]
MLKSSQDVPHLPGVYALIHRASATCFVGPSGDLHQRWIVWRSILSRSLASKRRRGFPDFPVEEWEFKIVLAREGLTEAELTQAVAHTIDRARKQGMTVVNRAAKPPRAYVPTQKFDKRAHTLSQMPVQIHDEHGVAITYAEAAEQLGRSVDGVKEAMKRARSTLPDGVDAISIDKLFRRVRRI